MTVYKMLEGLAHAGLGTEVVMRGRAELPVAAMKLEKGKNGKKVLVIYPDEPQYRAELAKKKGES